MAKQKNGDKPITSAEEETVLRDAQDQARDAERDRIRDDRRDTERDLIRDAQRDEDRDAAHDPVRDKLRDEERDPIRDAERDEKRDAERDIDRDLLRDAEKDEMILLPETRVEGYVEGQVVPENTTQVMPALPE